MTDTPTTTPDTRSAAELAQILGAHIAFAEAADQDEIGAVLHALAELTNRANTAAGLRLQLATARDVGQREHDDNARLRTQLAERQDTYDQLSAVNETLLALHEIGAYALLDTPRERGEGIHAAFDNVANALAVLWEHQRDRLTPQGRARLAEAVHHTSALQKSTTAAVADAINRAMDREDTSVIVAGAPGVWTKFPGPALDGYEPRPPYTEPPSTLTLIVRATRNRARWITNRRKATP